MRKLIDLARSLKDKFHKQERRFKLWVYRNLEDHWFTRWLLEKWHGQYAPGERLPSENHARKNPTRFKPIFWTSVGLYLVLIWIMKTAARLKWQTQQPGYQFIKTVKVHGQLKTMGGLHVGQAMKYAANPLNNNLPLKIYGLVLIVAICLAVAISFHFNYATNKVAWGQQGDSRLTTVKEIQEQYKEIPDHDNPRVDPLTPSFPGYGGLPISHLGKKYYIDDETANALVIGASRSGKGQIVVLPMLDILSRAGKKCSIISTDPKLENYIASSDMLRKRGYDVFLLNMADPANSMSYNPLSIVMKYWEQGDIESAIPLVNSLSYILYHKADAGQNSWVYSGAQHVFSGMVIALIRFCEDPDNFKDNRAHPEKVTLNNIVDMMTELGNARYYERTGGLSEEHNALDDYFENLPQSLPEKQLYAGANFSAPNSKGSIFQTVVDRLQNFELPKNARMTSLNSIPLKAVGFPKYVDFAFPDSMSGHLVKIEFRKPWREFAKSDRRRTKNRKGYHPLIKTYTARVGDQGFVEYNFDCHLEEGDLLEIVARVNNSNFQSWYKIHFPVGDEKPIGEERYALDLQTLQETADISNVQLHYSEKPIAIFMNLPDWDPSNNQLVSIFISQLYGELAKQCQLSPGDKTTRRIQFLLDEFGNVIPINDMDHIMTVSAGRNILFTLVLQSYGQLKTLYKGRAETIKENAQNKILIKTDDNRTNKEFSDAAGKRTIEGGSIHKTTAGLASSYNARAESVPVISATTLSQMLMGDDLVLRSVHRQDNSGRMIRAYPIYNHGQTRMPYAYMFLNDEFNPQKSPSLIKVESLHKSLQLSNLRINFMDFLKGHASDRAIQAYKEHLDENEQRAKELSGKNTLETRQKEEAEKRRREELHAQKEQEQRRVAQAAVHSNFFITVRQLYSKKELSKDAFGKFRDAIAKQRPELFDEGLAMINNPEVSEKLTKLREKEKTN